MKLNLVISNQIESFIKELRILLTQENIESWESNFSNEIDSRNNQVKKSCCADHVLYCQGAYGDAFELHLYCRASSEITLDASICLSENSSLSETKLNEMAEVNGIRFDLLQKLAWLTGVKVYPVQGIILAGGKSSRMGTDKAQLKVGDATLVERLKRIVMPLCDDLLVSVAKNKKSPLDGVRVVEDMYDGKGPLIGLYSALREAKYNICIVTACDIPFIPSILFRKMLMYTNEYDIIVPSFEAGYVEPMMGIYSKKCISAIELLLNNENNKHRVRDLIAICKTKTISHEDHEWYANLNTLGEYTAYCKNLR